MPKRFNEDLLVPYPTLSIRQRQALTAFLSREAVDGVQEFEAVFLEEAMDSGKDGSKRKDLKR